MSDSVAYINIAGGAASHFQRESVGNVLPMAAPSGPADI
jgi:hypothetical protein